MSKVHPKSMKKLLQNSRKSSSGPPFWHAFVPWSLSGDALETILGWGPKKTQKDHFLRPSFWSTFVTNVGTFEVTFFTCFLNSLLPSFLLRQALPGLN